MKILLTNYILNTFSGSEINAIQIANELINKGHEVYIFTFIYKNPLKSYIESNMKNLKVIDKDTLSNLEEFDLIWAHQQSTLNYVLFDLNIKSKKIIYSCLSSYDSAEFPPQYTNYLSLCLVNSEETKNTLLSAKVSGEKLFLLKNFITDEFYNTNKSINLNTPKKVCLVSNHIQIEVLKAVHILRNKGIEVDIYGVHYNLRMITADILSNYDAVITIGKTVQYSLSMGIPVYCYDRFTGPGWITQSNFYKAQEYNFSGRGYNIKRSSEQIVNEFIEGYSIALKDTNLYLKNIIKENNLLSNNIDEIIDIINSKDYIDTNFINSNFKHRVKNKFINFYPQNCISNYEYNISNEKLKFTSIVILTYNNLPYTKLCIEGIKKFTPNDSYEIIVVDNNSTDGTVEWLKLLTDLKVIFNSENKGFPAGCNQGINIAKGEAILLLNNDTIVTPNWLNNMQKALYSSSDIGAVGPVSNSCSNLQQIHTSYNDLNEMLDFASTYNVSNKNGWRFKTKLIGFCCLIKREVINKVGLLDEIFTPGKFEDDDYSYRIICNGYKLLLCTDTFIHHFGSVSFEQTSPAYLNTFNKNKEKFKEKWGFDSLYSSAMRNDIINLIKEDDKNKNLNILYIKCGIGSMLLEIKNIYKNANLYGIETSLEAYNVAKNVCDCVVKDIEKDELPYEEHYFDYIIMGDIIGELNKPMDVIGNIKKYIKYNGHIIMRIPNIMHISIVSKLLKGSFTNEESGKLDENYFKGFTLSDGKKLLTSNDYSIESEHALILYIEKSDEDFISELCTLCGENLRQQYRAYEYVIKAKPNGNLLDL